MTYGLSTRAPAENALVQRAFGRANWGGWRQLDSEKRLELIEQALAAPANDVVDGYPIAL